MSDLLRNFMDEQTEEEKLRRQKSMDSASSEGGVLPLKISGTYLMEVATFAYREKEKKRMRVSPEAYISEKKRSLNLNINLRVVDGTPQVPKGSSIFMNIVLSPAKGADQTKIDNVNRMLKPRLAVLTGEKNVKLSADWFEEWLIPKFEEKDGQFIMVKDHKMKQKVLAVIEDDVYQDKDVLKVAALLEASENSKSVSNVLNEQAPVSEQGSAVPSPEDFSAINATSAVIPEVDNRRPEAIPDVPDGIEDF